MADDENAIPVFLCYRQADGSAAAHWLYEHLNGQPISDVPGAATLKVYFDKGAPAVADWKAVHCPPLERAKAFVFICTRGALQL